MQMRIALTVCVLLTMPLLAHPAVSVAIDSRGNVYYSDLAYFPDRDRGAILRIAG